MRQLIKANGETIDLKGPFSLIDVQRIFDFKSLMFLELLDDEHMMILQDEDTRMDCPINEMATIICNVPYMPNMQPPIRGDVLIVPTRDIAPYQDVI